MSPVANPLIILDRDGVINFDSEAYIKSPDEWHAIPGSPEAIAELCKLGFDVYVVTNQSGIGRGLFSKADYTAITKKMLDTIDAAGGYLRAVVHCPHAPDEHCDCRKPNTGLFKQVAEFSGQSLNGVIAVGDSLRDLQAAADFGCAPVLVRTGNGEQTKATLRENSQLYDLTVIFSDLRELVTHLSTTGGTL